MRIRRWWDQGVAVLLATLVPAAHASPILGNPLIEIPGGGFLFGSDRGRENERPERRIELPGFRMLRTEVTNVQYRDFAIATGRQFPAHAVHSVLGRDDHPVVGVSWDDADAFCRHHGLRLPSEREYERAARGRDGAPFPWGHGAPTADRVNRGARECCRGDAGDGYFLTAPVGSFPRGASLDGVLDLVGNVWEWTRDWYAPYEDSKGRVAGAGPDASPDARKFRVLRGGSWNNGEERLSTTYRLAYDPSFRFAANGGFRCVAHSP